MALAWGVSTSVTSVLNSSIIASVTSPPFSLASDFCNEPRWSMAAAAITPRSFDTALSPFSFPGVSFMTSSEEFDSMKSTTFYSKPKRSAGILPAVLRAPSARRTNGRRTAAKGAPLLPQRQRSQQPLLFGDQRLDALSRQRHHLRQLSVVEYLMFGGGLQFHDLVPGRHDHVHVDIRA